MKKTTALKLAWGDRPRPVSQPGVRELAKILGVTRQAVQAWGDEVPKKHEDTLRKIRPEWFSRNGRKGTKQ